MAERPRYGKIPKDITTKFPEKKTEINNTLPQKTKEALRKDGRIIFQIKPLSIRDLILSGHKIEWVTDDEMRSRITGKNNTPNIDIDTPAPFQEVAIDPQNLFLNRPYNEGTGKRVDIDSDGELVEFANYLSDKVAVDNYSKEVSENYPGAKAITGDPATWAQIFHKYEKTTEKRLINRDGRYAFIGAETQSVKWKPRRDGKGEGVIIGHSIAAVVIFPGHEVKQPLYILDWGGPKKEKFTSEEGRREEMRSVGIASLIVPSNKATIYTKHSPNSHPSGRYFEPKKGLTKRVLA